METQQPTDHELDALAALCARGPVTVLTGAGVSTESGIPDYRGPETRRRARNPMQYREFLRSAAARRRYWARSLIGWPRMAAARPSDPHVSLAELERSGHVSGLLTQNVDSLHSVAGSAAMVELHGALREVICLACGALAARSDVQACLEQRNPGFSAQLAELAPDGDADLTDETLDGFQVIDCAACGGPLKPHVVFFGENVPKDRVARAFSLAERGAALLVIGSSLAVYSGLRFVHAAKKRGVPVAIVNLGPTRADPDASLRIEARAGAVLRALVTRLAAR